MRDGKRGVFSMHAKGAWSNPQLTKDCGIIPYLLYKNYGFRAVMVGAKADIDYPYLKQYVRGIEMDFLPENTLQAQINYINAHADEMDLLICHGAFPQYVPIVDFYKKVRPDGKIYLATDMNIGWGGRLPHTNPDYGKFIQSCDVVAASCRATQKYLSAKWGVPVEMIRNGWYNFPQVSSSAGLVLIFRSRNVATYCLKLLQKLPMKFPIGNCDSSAKCTKLLNHGLKIIFPNIPICASA